MTPRAASVIQRASHEAAELGHDYIGVEHLLLAILNEGESVAVVAISHVTTVEELRTELVRILNSENYQQPTRKAMRL